MKGQGSPVTPAKEPGVGGRLGKVGTETEQKRQKGAIWKEIGSGCKGEKI